MLGAGMGVTGSLPDAARGRRLCAARPDQDGHGAGDTSLWASLGSGPDVAYRRLVSIRPVGTNRTAGEPPAKLDRLPALLGHRKRPGFVTLLGRAGAERTTTGGGLLVRTETPSSPRHSSVTSRWRRFEGNCGYSGGHVEPKRSLDRTSWTCRHGCGTARQSPYSNKRDRLGNVRLKRGRAPY